MMSSLRVIQWNCYSVQSAYPDLSSLVTNLSPDVLLLQESWLSPPIHFSLPNFRSYRLDRTTRRGGGLLILISSGLVHSATVIFEHISPSCEILAVRLCLPNRGPLTLINTYCPSGFVPSPTFESVLRVAGPDFILAGDFNAHHVSWGNKTNCHGLDLSFWIGLHGLAVGNDGSFTYVRGLCRSTPDVTLFSPLLSFSSWKTVDCGTNSDHLPVFFEIMVPRKDTIWPRRHCNRKLEAQALAHNLAQYVDGSDLDRAKKAVISITSSITEATFIQMKRTPSGCAPWWTETTARDWRRRKAAWKSLLANSCFSNWKNYQLSKARFRRTVAQAKRDFYSSQNRFLSQPRNRKALHKHVALMRRLVNAPLSSSSTLSDNAARSCLEETARGLAQRFLNRIPQVSTPIPHSTLSFTPVTHVELDRVVRALPNTAPGPDHITYRSIKYIWAAHAAVLLSIVNMSLAHAWIPDEWKCATVMVLKKKPSAGLTLENIRPIALTSALCKVVERVLHGRLTAFVEEAGVLNSSQIGFRPHSSIWYAHITYDTLIRLARERRMVSALVTLDVAMAYDSVEHMVLLQRLEDVAVPRYMLAWIKEFLSNRTFTCTDGRLQSSVFPLRRGVPQGSVLSPILFNLLMSAMPLDPGIRTFTYADDIAFFTSAGDHHTLRDALQEYLDRLSAWLTSVHLALNVQKSAVVVFRAASPVTIELFVGSSSIPHTTALKYLGVWYDEHLTWQNHLDYTVDKAERALTFLRRCSSPRIGLRRDALIYLYIAYVRPILEFGCVLFSQLRDYRLAKLFIFERRVLRLCLGLPSYSANDALYHEARIMPLKSRFRYITISTFLHPFLYPIGCQLCPATRDTRAFLRVPWGARNIPQITFVEQLLAPLTISLRDFKPVTPHEDAPAISVADPFQGDVRSMSTPRLVALLTNSLSRNPDHLVVATDASVVQEKAGAGICIPALDCHFPVRLPDFTPISEAELLAIVLGLRCVPQQYARVVVLSDSLSVVTALTTAPWHPFLRIVSRYAPPHLQNIILTWVPGHRGIPANEAADQLAKMALSGPILPVLPAMPAIVRARYRRMQRLASITAPRAGYDHLAFPWNPTICENRSAETWLTRLRCLALPLNFYLYRGGKCSSPSCGSCGVDETVVHFLMDCPLYHIWRRSHIEDTLRRCGIPLTITNVLSFGRSHTGRCEPQIARSLYAFILASGRF